MDQRLHTRRYAPATLRNREPILAVLQRVLPETGTVLEIASGTGEHVAFFAQQLPKLVWQPSDFDSTALESIAAWTAAANVTNVRPPLVLDVSKPWPEIRADAVVNINMIHISPFDACEGLMRGAARALCPGGVLYMYGPFTLDGEHTATSNEAFDMSLRARNPAWGVRDVDEVSRVARQSGLALEENLQMPANNRSLVFRLS